MANQDPIGKCGLPEVNNGHPGNIPKPVADIPWNPDWYIATPYNGFVKQSPYTWVEYLEDHPS